MQASQAFQLEETAGQTIVTPLPGLNELDWAEMEHSANSVLEHLRTSRKPSLVVDLTGLDYLGSAKIALLVRMYKVIRERGGALVVVCREPVILEELHLAGLTKLWTIVPTRDRGLTQVHHGGLSLDGHGGPSSPPGTVLSNLVGLVLVLVAAILTFVAATLAPAAAQGLLIGALIVAGLAVIAGLLSFFLAPDSPKLLPFSVVALSIGFLVWGAIGLRPPVGGPRADKLAAKSSKSAKAKTVPQVTKRTESREEAEKPMSLLSPPVSEDKKVIVQTPPGATSENTPQPAENAIPSALDAINAPATIPATLNHP